MNPTEAWYHVVFDVLVEIAGASEGDRAQFVYDHTRERPSHEWRFQGKLGFGGKYWRERNTVSCHAEDETKDRLETILKTNKALFEMSNGC
jgi:hypothetical protein